MSTVDKADNLAQRIVRSYPHWPVTMNNCTRCEKGSAPGADVCPECLVIELAEIIDSPLLANELKMAAKNMCFLRVQVLELARDK